MEADGTLSELLVGGLACPGNGKGRTTAVELTTIAMAALWLYMGFIS
jgi:hypothetical protein